METVDLIIKAATEFYEELRIKTADTVLGSIAIRHLVRQEPEPLMLII